MHEKDSEEIRDIEVSGEEGDDVKGGAEQVPPGSPQPSVKKPAEPVPIATAPPVTGTDPK